MNATVFRCNDFSFNAPLPEPRTDEHALHVGKFFHHTLLRNIFTVNEMKIYLHSIVYACQIKAFTNTLVGILQVILPDKADVNDLPGTTLPVEEVMPGLHGRFTFCRNAHLP